jgi:hypothetical protein
MQLIKITETEINILFPDGYEILLDESGVFMSVGELFEFTGTHYVVSEVRHKFVAPKDSNYRTERIHKIVIVLSKQANESA